MEQQPALSRHRVDIFRLCRRLRRPLRIAPYRRGPRRGLSLHGRESHRESELHGSDRRSASKSSILCSPPDCHAERMRTAGRGLSLHNRGLSLHGEWVDRRRNAGCCSMAPRTSRGLWLQPVGFRRRGLSLHDRGFPLQDSDSATKRGLSLHSGGQRLQERGPRLQRCGLPLHARLWSDSPRFDEPRIAGNPDPQSHRPAVRAEPVPTALRRPHHDTARRHTNGHPTG